MPETDSLYRSIATTLAEVWGGGSTRPAAQPPGPALPLQGVTLLVVEDSRFACEALRLMAQRSGARMRRAATLSDARRHLSLYRPDVVLIDMGLPDGSGAALIRELAVCPPGGPLVLGMSGDAAQRGAALAAGAAGFAEKPIAGLAGFQTLLLRHLPGRGASLIPAAEVLAPDPLSLSEDLAHAAGLLAAGPDADQRVYLAGFLTGVARSADDRALELAARALPAADPAAVRAVHGMVAVRLGRGPDAFCAVDRNAERSVERSAERSADRSADRSAGHAGHRPSDRPSDRARDCAT